MDDVNNMVVADTNDNKSKRHYWLIIPLVILILVLGVSVYFIQRQTFYKSRAYSYTEQPVSQPANNIEIANSYAFASPLKAKAGGEYIRVTVYVLDAQGLGIKGKSVEIGQMPELSVNNPQATTDDSGMVFFDVSSTKTGLYVVQPVIESKPLDQRINITFD